MKEAAKYPFFVLICETVLSLALISCGAVTTKPFLISTSPGGTYTVRVGGNGDMPLMPIIGTNHVEIEVLKEGSKYFSNEPFHAGGFLDATFNGAYPDHEWIDDRIIRFYSSREYDSNRVLNIEIKNSAKTGIVFMKLYCTDKFLFLDIASESNHGIQCSGPKGDRGSLYVEGEFSGGNRFKNGFSFPREDFAKSPCTIEISDDTVAFHKS